MIVETLRLKGLSKGIIFILASVFLSFPSFAQHEEGSEDLQHNDHAEALDKNLEDSESKFNASEMIMHHVSDAHEIHFIGEGENSIALYLPIILNTKEGWKIFSSSHF